MSSPEPATGVRHAARFHLFTGALIFVAVLALGLAVVFAATSDDQPQAGTAWAPFKPTSDGLDTGAGQIADVVGRQYRLSSGEQLALVTGGPMEFLVDQQKLPMRIVTRDSVADGGAVKLVRGRGVLYRMCGLGPKCSIGTGKTSTDRGLVLRREALELALYSFHDLDDVDNVVVFLPPEKGKDPSVAMHFRRADLSAQLAQPLRATLPLPVPDPDTIATSPEKSNIQRLTYATLFKFSLTTGNQDANVFLVLDPLQTGS